MSIYLEKQTESNPLIVGHVSSFLFLIHIWGHDTRMGNLGSNMQGQGSWDGISGMDPAVEVEHVVWHIFGMNAVCKNEIKFLDKSREPKFTRRVLEW